jgi:hypothetical protein
VTSKQGKINCIKAVYRMVSTFFMIWLSTNRRIDVADQSISSIPRPVKDSNGSTIFYTWRSIKEDHSYFLRESAVCQKGS